MSKDTIPTTDNIDLRLLTHWANEPGGPYTVEAVTHLATYDSEREVEMARAAFARAGATLDQYERTMSPENVTALHSTWVYKDD